MRIVLIILAVACGAAFGQTDRALAARFDRAYGERDFEAAERAAETLAERHPSSGLWAFNAACANARNGDLEGAASWLTAAAERGFQGVRSVETDEDLDPIRGTPEFGAALEMIRAAARARLEEFRRAARGHEHPSWVPEDAGADRRVPLVIALHGTGGRGEEMLRAWRGACERVGAAIIAPDALRPSGGGFAWTYRDEAEWLVLDLIERAAKEMPIDPGRVILTGFSQGANVAMPLGVEHAGRFRAVVPVCGHYEGQIVDLESEPAAERPRYAFVIGASDPWASTFREADREFREAGVETMLEVVRGMGHEMPAGRAGTARLARVLEWCLREADEGGEAGEGEPVEAAPGG